MTSLWRQRQQCWWWQNFTAATVRNSTIVLVFWWWYLLHLPFPTLFEEIWWWIYFLLPSVSCKEVWWHHLVCYWLCCLKRSGDGICFIWYCMYYLKRFDEDLVVWRTERDDQYFYCRWWCDVRRRPMERRPHVWCERPEKWWMWMIVGRLSEWPAT